MGYPSRGEGAFVGKLGICCVRPKNIGVWDFVILKSLIKSCWLSNCGGCMIERTL